MSDRPTLILLDGHSLAYRAFYALPDTLQTRTGQITNAVYGFTSMLIRLLTDRKPDGIAVAFDKGRDIERTAAFPEYKATRSTPPDAFRPQIGLIEDVLEAMHIPIIKLPGVEADDVIATLTQQAKANGFQVFIVTGDRDSFQLVDEHTTVLYTARGVTDVRVMTPESVLEKYGVRPDQYVDYAALRGDNSDNLPGVPGVGEKTAAKLISAYDNIEGIYDNVDKISGKKVPAMLIEHRPQVEMNKRLMTLRRAVDVEAPLEHLRMGDADIDEVRRVFGALEFRALYDRLIADVLGVVEEQSATGFERSPVRASPGDLAQWLDGVNSFAVAPVVEGKVPSMRWVAGGLAAADKDPIAFIVDDLNEADGNALTAALASADVAVAAHDVKDLMHAARSRGWPVAAVAIDTMLAAYILGPEQRSFDLDLISLQYLQRTITVEDDDTAGDQLALVVDDPWEQRALRAQATWMLGEHLAAELDERGQRALHDDFELPLAEVLADMEQAGIGLDLSVLDTIRERLSKRVAELELEVHDLAGHSFNIGSGPQLQEVLFDELELPKTRKIKTGYSTDAKALQGMEDAHPIIDAIIEWREVSKLLSTYVDALPRERNAVTGRVHTTLSQTVAATGRLSSSNPNLQNIPVRREEGREIRKAFVPGESYDTFLVADYSQIELRIMAHLSKDEGLLEAFGSGEDIHATTAAKVFDLPLDQIDGALRDRAKAVNYGLAYGLTAFGLSQQLGIAPDEAAEIVNAYMERFPGVSTFLNDAVVGARRDGFTTTMFGRRRYLPDLLSDNRNRRQMAERMALNAPIQGTAADVMKLAMIRVSDALRAAPELHAQVLLQVHDELILEVADKDLQATQELVVTAMSGVAELAVPLLVDTADGTTWYAAQKH